MTLGRRILVVEDNELNLKLVRDVLGHAGFDVVEARTGEEGVELASTCDPALILMDLQLPDINGDRKSTRLNSSHNQISYAVFCLKKKKKKYTTMTQKQQKLKKNITQTTTTTTKNI